MANTPRFRDNPKGYLASRHVDFLDLDQATDVVGRADANSNFQFLHLLSAEEIRSVTRILAGDTVYDKDGNVRDNPASNITYQSGPTVGTALQAQNVQEALDELTQTLEASGSQVMSVSHTRGFNALPGTDDQDKLNGLYSPATPQDGDLVVVGYEPGMKQDTNDKAGIWMLRKGTWDQVLPLTDAMDERIELHFHKLVQLEKAVTLSLLYRITPQMHQQDPDSGNTYTYIDLKQPDELNRHYELAQQPPYEGLELYLNGVRLVPSNAHTQFDYLPDYQTSIIEVQYPLTVGHLVQIDVLLPAELIVPGAVDIHRIRNFSIDGTTSKNVQDGVRTVFPLFSLQEQDVIVPLSVDQVLVFKNGEALIPGEDYILNPGRPFEVKMTAPPTGKDEVWALYFAPGKAGTSGTGQGVQPPDPALQGFLLDYSWIPGKGPDWVDAREDMGIVNAEKDLSDRTILPLGHLQTGKLVYARDTGMLYEFIADATTAKNTIDDWKPLVSGVSYVGRARDLPYTATDGQLFVMRMDMDGDDMYRLIAWDDSIPATATYVPISQLGWQVTPASVANGGGQRVSPPDSIDIQFILPPKSAIGQEGTVGFRVFWDENGNRKSQGFIVPVKPGDTVRDIANYLEAEFLAKLPNNEILAAQNGALLTLTPRALTPPITPLNDIGPLTAAPVPPFTIGDWGEVTQDIQIGNQAIPAGSTILYVGKTFGTGGWVIEFPQLSGTTSVTVSPGGNPQHSGASATFAGVNNLGYFGAGMMHVAGEYWIHTGGTYTFPAPDPQYPELGNLAGQTVGNRDFIVVTGPQSYEILQVGSQAHNDILTAFNTATVNGSAEIVTVGGTLIAAPTPPVDWQEPGTTPFHIHIDNIIDVNVATGTLQTNNGGGWRYLNREIWDKALRADEDQRVDQRAGDLQVTREDQHEEIKAWNAASGQWDTIYSRDEINGAIAAMSLFEGTVNEVGGGAIGAIEVDTLPDLVTLSTASDLSDVSHYWTWIGTPNYTIPGVGDADEIANGISRDLAGAILNPGDWIQIANRGGDGTGQGSNGGAVDLRWVTVGGDLLAKARADRLFGLQPWSAAGWEQGSLTLYQGEVYRAAQPVTASDPNPAPTETELSIPLSGFTFSNLQGNPTDAVEPNPADGDQEIAMASGTHAAGQPFAGKTYAAGDHFFYSADPALTGKGTTAGGYQFDSGWIALGQTAPPDPYEDTVPAPTTPWTRVNISGGLKVAADDAALPGTAPPGQVWIVLASAKAGGDQALYAYDTGATEWRQLGGGGKPLELGGGSLVIPRAYYVDTSSPGDPKDDPATFGTPFLAGDMLITRVDAGQPLVRAVAQHTKVDPHNAPKGAVWEMIHPQRFTPNLEGNNRSAKADYPMQLQIGIAGNEARVTHIADRDLNWIPVVKPKMYEQSVISNRNWSEYYDASSGVLIFEGMAINSAEWVPGLWFRNSTFANQDITVTVSKGLFTASNSSAGTGPTTLSVRPNGSGDLFLHTIRDNDARNGVLANAPCYFRVESFQLGNMCIVKVQQNYRRSGFDNAYVQLHAEFIFMMTDPWNLIAYAADNSARLDKIVTIATAIGTKP